ncbi:MAG: metal-sensitive transcriptional regulator [Spirochaetes bacterium]|nr:metal-sensitive transcriptional regulator [Spirochaetota bacterium]
MAIDETARSALQRRINRVIGQLQGLQKRIATGETDCLADIQQIKAAKNAMWKVAEEYMHIYLRECMDKKLPAADMEQKLQSVVRASFTM